MQIIITDRVLNTFLEAAEFLGSFTYDSFTMPLWSILGYDEIQNMTTSSDIVKDLMPELEKKYGTDVEVGFVIYPDGSRITCQRSPFEDIVGDIPLRVNVMVKTGDEKKPGTMLWERVFDATFYTKESFGLYMNKND